jgi:hypothetical protein
MDLKSVKEQLDAVGPGMCLAKWKQVTIHLGTGHTHSCHHPNTHVIPIEEIKVNPSALHNTQFKKNKRREMLEGQRPSECQYCWNVEDSVKSDNVFSDRVTKSSEIWAQPHFNEVIDAGYEKNISPSYMEISFSYACNFKCSYCSPEISSKWMEEIQQYGPYPTHLSYNGLDHFKQMQKMPIAEREENPYVDAFWQWWPEIYPTLHTFRITGGEPLMTKHTFKVLDYIIENPNPNLELGINSNLGVPKKLIDDFIDKVKIILDKKLVKSVKLYTSCEAYGTKAEYIRFGLNYKEWYANCQRLLSELPELEFSVMSTYNALSVTSYDLFLNDWLNLKKDFRTRQRNVSFDAPYLRNPEWLTIGILPKEYITMAESSYQFVKNNKPWFQDYEIARMERIYELFQSQIDKPMPYLNTWRKDFFLFVNEHDRRRGTNFLETFPEMSNFYHFCKKF